MIWYRLAAFSALVVVATNTLAMSGTSQVAWRDKPVPAQPDWPAGVLDLVREGEAGVRVFGVRRLREPPIAHPPTLTLHVGNDAIDLKSLKIPPAVEVTAVVSAADRAEGRNAASLKAIDDFVARHQTKSTKPASKRPEPTSK